MSEVNKIVVKNMDSLLSNGSNEGNFAPPSQADLPDKDDVIQDKDETILEDRVPEVKAPEKVVPAKKVEPKREEPKKEEPKAEEKKEEVEDDEPESVVAQFKELANSEFEVELEGEYEESIEGVFQASKDLGSALANKVLNDVFNKFPEAYDLINHLKNGGKPDEWASSMTQTFKNVVIDKDDVSQQEAVVRAGLKGKFDADEIEEYIENAKDKGTLYSKSLKNLETLKADEEKRIAERESLTQAQREREKAEAEELRLEINKTINNGKLLNVPLTKSQQNEFMDYLYKKDKSGKSASDVKWENLTVEQNLMIEWIVKNDFKGLTTDTVEKKKATLLDLKKENDKRKDLTRGGETGRTVESPNRALGKINVNALIGD